MTELDLFRTASFIDGEWVPAASGATFEVINPADGAIIGTAPNGGADDARCAIDAASAAFPAWRAKTAADRAALLRRLHDLILAHQDHLALLLTREQGKTLAEAKGEVA